MVYAQYDDDGIHKDLATGREVKHTKGEYKLNDSGHFYSETLGDRDINGKQIVNPTDLITTDESNWNKIDFFDSDGKNKSVTGTVFKLGVELAPFFIPGSQGIKIAQYYGAINRVDITIGKIINKLQETGLKENTLFIFTTDHGSPFPRAKCTLYDPGIKTILIIYQPESGLF